MRQQGVVGASCAKSCPMEERQPRRPLVSPACTAHACHLERKSIRGAGKVQAVALHVVLEDEAELPRTRAVAALQEREVAPAHAARHLNGRAGSLAPVGKDWRRPPTNGPLLGSNMGRPSQPLVRQLGLLLGE